MALPSLIKRCLAHGVKIYPYQLDTVMHQYGVNNIPSVHLDTFGKEEIEKYVDGLYLSVQEIGEGGMICLKN